jgi:hypothetical protein
MEPKRSGNSGPVLEGLEPALRVLVVVGDVRPTMSFWSRPDQPALALSSLRFAIGVDGQSACHYTLFLAGISAIA